MKNLTATLCLTIVVLLGSGGVSWSVDLQKNLDSMKSGDFATAIKEWKLLAEQGNAQAQNNLGVMYRSGFGVPKDDQTALKWFRLAAEQGDPFAQANLGFMYANGMGVLQDWVYAHMWSNIAVSSGLMDAGNNFRIFTKRMTPSQLEKAQNLARECVLKQYKAC